MQTCQCPFANAVWCVDCTGIGGFDEVLADDVDGALARVGQVLQAVFAVGEATCEAEREQGRVLRYVRRLPFRVLVGEHLT